MFQLNYRSEATPDLDREELQNILTVAKEKNAQRDISGCLIFHKNCFVQILEGKKEDVLQLYEKIKEDDRHNNITLLWENEVENRYFPDWNMAYYNPEDKNLRLYLDNMLLLSELSIRSSASLLSFWASVRTILRKGNEREFENK